MTNGSTTTDLSWMELALAEAAKAQADSPSDVPIGAVIVQGDKLIATAHNRREKDQDPTAHAELLVIKQAARVLETWRLEGTTLYTTLEPCPMCAEAIIQGRVTRLVFGAYDPKSGAVGSAFNLFVPGRIYPIPEVLGGIAEEKCRTILLNFFRDNRTYAES